VFFLSSFQFCSGSAKNVCVRDADGSDSSDASDAACGVVDEEEEEEEEEENDDGTYVFVMAKNKRLETKPFRGMDGCSFARTSFDSASTADGRSAARRPSCKS